MDKPIVTKATIEDIEKLQILFEKYQCFYEAESYDKENKDFLTNILQNDDQGIFHIIFLDSNPIGFSGIYFSYSSVLAKKIAIINDLFIEENYRKNGYGKILINHTIEFLENNNFNNIRWCTRADNEYSQKLYDNFAANKSSWIHYDLKITK